MIMSVNPIHVYEEDKLPIHEFNEEDKLQVLTYIVNIRRGIY